MKKIFALMLAGLTVVSFAACGGEKNGTDTENSAVETTGSLIEVDEGLFNVDLRIPKSYYGSITDEEIIAQVADSGAKNIKISEEGYVEFTISKKERDTLLDELKSSVDEFWNVPEEERAMPSLAKIEYNNDMTRLDFYVDAEKYNVFENFTIFALMQIPGYYQMLNGVTEENMDIKVRIIDNASAELIDEISYKEMKESMESFAEATE